MKSITSHIRHAVSCPLETQPTTRASQTSHHQLTKENQNSMSRNGKDIIQSGISNSIAKTNQGLGQKHVKTITHATIYPCTPSFRKKCLKLFSLLQTISTKPQSAIIASSSIRAYSSSWAVSASASLVSGSGAGLADFTFAGDFLALEPFAGDGFVARFGVFCTLPGFAGLLIGDFRPTLVREFRRLFGCGIGGTYVGGLYRYPRVVWFWSPSQLNFLLRIDW